MENIYQQLTRLEESFRRVLLQIEEIKYALGPMSPPPQIQPQGQSDGTVFLHRRQREVYDLLKSGLTPRQVSERLRLNIKTVYSHRRIIRQKLNIKPGNQITGNFSTL